MSGEGMDEGRDADSTAPGGAPGPGKLRRGVFGYRRADVEGVIEARESELAELRRDIAALWLAFAQHDRMIREGITIDGPAPRMPVYPEPVPPRVAPQTERAPEPYEAPAETQSVASQLSDLDDVLAAIEMATQSLERTYAEEIAVRRIEPEPEIRPGSIERD